MKETATLKRSAFLYAFSILFTGMVNFLAIPILKYKAGTSEFAFLNLYMNLLLVLAYVGAGWLNQSCIRFYPTFSTDKGFYKAFQKMALVSAGATAVVALVVVLFFSHYPWMVWVFPLSLVVVNLQMMSIAWLQASVRPQTVAMAEVLRALVFLCVIWFIQPHKGYNVMAVAWAGWMASYLVSLFFLWAKSRNSAPVPGTADTIAPKKPFWKTMLAFGLPLSLWSAAMYGIYFADRFFMLRFTSSNITGHYSSLFDVLQKGMGFALSPLVTAVYPLMTRLNEEGNTNGLRQLGKKVLRWQLLITVATVVGYIVFWPWVQNILGIPQGDRFFFYTGLALLLGAALWQINTLLQKPLELRGRTKFLLALISVDFLLLVLGGWYFIPRHGMLGAAGVFLLTAVVYQGVIVVARCKLKG